MKIAIVGSLWNNTPPRTYGGTEEVIFHLTNGLVEKGHEVTFFGPETAQTKARLLPVVDKPLLDQGRSWNNEENIHAHILKFTKVLQMSKAFDIIHIHLDRSQDYIAFPTMKSSTTPVLFTMHFSPQLYKEERQERLEVLAAYKDYPFSSISNAQRKGIDLNFIANIYNGIQISDYPYSNVSDDYVAWLGKIKPEKGTKEAILAAKKAGVNIMVMGKVDENIPSMYQYFKEEVEPLFDGEHVIWVGEVGLKEKVTILKRAKALLNPIQWEEPFGLVMIEALALGTPVISYNRGAAGEIIRDQETGFLVDSFEEMCGRITDIGSINRKNCRMDVEKSFTTTTMIHGYEKAYDLVIGSWRTV